MSRKDKLLQRLCGVPKDFTWEELESLLRLLGYRIAKAGKTSGSRRRFVHDMYAPLSLHEPHPQRVLKQYQIQLVIEALRQEGIL